MEAPCQSHQPSVQKTWTYHAPKANCYNQRWVRLSDLRKARVAHHLRLLLPLLPVPPPRGRGRGGGGREPARQRLRAAAEAEDANAGVRGRPAAGGAARREVLVVERDGEAAGGVEGAVLGDDLQGSGLLEAA